MALASALAKAKGKLKQSETRVTTRDGRQYVERGGTVEFVGRAELPDYLKEEEKGFSSLKPARFSCASSSWDRTECNKRGDAELKDVAPLTKLRVVTFNVWFAKQDFDARASLLFDILKELSPDIICLQEVTPRLVKLIVKQDWVRGQYWLSDCTGVTVTPYGVLMMSRLPVHSLALYLIPTNMGRRLLAAELSIPVGGSSDIVPLRVATVHLESPIPGQVNEDYREAQLKTVFPLLADSENSMLMGDFNFDPSKPEQACLDSSYTDVWCALHPDEPGLTFREYPGRIDRMILKSSCAIRPAKVDILGAEPNAEGICPSDHNGLCCDFILSAP